MKLVKFQEQVFPMVYVILGIDENGHDQVVAVCSSYADAKKYCIEFLVMTGFYDLWIEKHPLLAK